MTDNNDPFAPLNGEELSRDLGNPDDSSEEKLEVVTPVPSDAERDRDAAARLFGRRPDVVWRYHDKNRRLLSSVARWNQQDGKKTILPLCVVRYPGRCPEWAFKHYPAPRPLYRLNLLADSPSAPVVIVEGEKCADAATEVFPQHVVTTSSGGAGAAGGSDWIQLTGRPEIIIWPDADEPGVTYAEQVAGILTELGALRIRIVDSFALAARAPNGSTREPIEGWDVADGLDEGWSFHALREAALECTSAWVSASRETEWPNGFAMTPQGLVKTRERENDEDEKVSGPFRVLGEGRDSSGAGRGLLLEWEDGDGREQRGFVRRADLVGETLDWLKDLNDRGFYGPILRKKITPFRLALYGCRSAKRITMVRRTGWFGSVFVLPHRTIGKSQGDSIIFEGRDDIARYAEKGTLEDWKKFVAAPAAGNSRLIFSLSTAFVGPIIDLLEEGSFGFNLVGASSIGKTTALIAAGSVWGGGGPLGFARSCRTTDNGAEGVFRAHSGTVIPLDELGQMAADVASALTYMFGNGHGKSRAARNGEARRAAEWCSILLSTGEVGVAGKIEETGRGRKAKAGQLVRLIDVIADAGKGFGMFENTGGKTAAEFAQGLRANALTYYGLAGPAFVAHLAASLTFAREVEKTRLRQRIDLLQNDLPEHIQGPDGQITRVARYFATVAVAGELAKAVLQLPWEDREATLAAGVCFHTWLSRRGGSDRQEILSAVTALREAIVVHGQSRFQNLIGIGNDTVDVGSEHLLRNMLGYRFALDGETVWGFTSAGIKEVLQGIGDITILLGQLAERGVIRRREDRLQIAKKISGIKRRLYVVPDTFVEQE